MNMCWNGQGSSTTITVFPKIWEQAKICMRKCGVKFKESQGSHDKQLQLVNIPKKMWDRVENYMRKCLMGKPTKMELCFLLFMESTLHWGELWQSFWKSKGNQIVRNIGNISYVRNFLENLKRKYDDNALKLIMPIIVHKSAIANLFLLVYPLPYYFF